MAIFSVLRAMDGAKTKAYHFVAIVVAGMGFFTDAYDLFCISFVTKLLGRLYYYDPTVNKPGSLPPNVAMAVTGVALCGTFAGQLYFGWLGDKLGRKGTYGITLLLMVTCSICSALSFGHSAKAVMTTLCFFRFWLGFGIGGDYPLSATIMSEYANVKTRGAFIGAVFAMQGIGILCAATVSIVVSAIFLSVFDESGFDENPLKSTPPEADYLWRIILGAGSIPAAFTFYWRMRMPETARYTLLVEGNAERAAMDMAMVLKVDLKDLQDLKTDSPDLLTSSPPPPRRQQFGLFSRQFFARHGSQLAGTAASWLFLDVAYYSQNLFQKDVFTAVGWLPRGNTMGGVEEVYRIARAQALVALFSTVPGYWVTVFTVDYFGRWLIQLQGFFFMTLFMSILAANYPNFRGNECPPPKTGEFCDGNPLAFIMLYALTFFFANFGPNATTFIIPAELFPARLRTTCNGICAASGKLGAIIGTFGFLYASQSENPAKIPLDPGYPKGIGYQYSLMILAITNLLGLFSTFFVPETRGRSLEELSGELMDTEAEEEQEEERTRGRRGESGQNVNRV